MKSYFYFILFIFQFSFSFSQVYKPIDTADYTERKAFLTLFASNNETMIKNLKSKYGWEKGGELSKFYEDFKKDFEKDVKNKDYTFKSVFDKEIEKILTALKIKNPNIPNDLKVLIAKDNVPNAYCLADGTFVVNMGLFSWLDNEDQVASVLSHELAHKIKEHTLKSLLDEVNARKTEKKEVQNMRDITINKTGKAFDIFKKRVYKKGVDKRKHEIEADSLGFVLFKNTPYKKTEFINALQNLKEYDSIPPRVLKIETYKALYNLPNQPFNEKWMKKEDFSLYNYNFYKDKLDKDSLSTHPEIVKRIEILKNNFPELKNMEKAKEGDEEFKNLKSIARKEILPNLYHSEDYGLGVYLAMQFLQENEDEAYYKQWLGKCFEKIYEGRKNYNLNRYLDRVDPKDQSESYQQFLNFMWNLNMEEIKNISDFYNKKEAS